MIRPFQRSPTRQHGWTPWDTQARCLLCYKSAPASRRRGHRRGQTVDAQTSTSPGYTSYAARNGLGTNSGEPSIGVNWHSGRVFVEANTQTLRVTFKDAVSPGTATWEDKSATPPQCTAATTFDPILFTDHATGRTFESQLIPTPALASLTCFSDTDGDSWTPSEGGGIGSGIDHQTLGGGPFGPAAVGPVGGYADAVYYALKTLAPRSVLSVAMAG